LLNSFCRQHTRNCCNKWQRWVSNNKYNNNTTSVILPGVSTVARKSLWGLYFWRSCSKAAMKTIAWWENFTRLFLLGSYCIGN
jgi:hypothetical protein